MGGGLQGVCEGPGWPFASLHPHLWTDAVQTDTRSIQPRDSDHVSVSNKVCSLQCDNRTGTDKQQSTKLAFVSHVEENEVCNIWCQASNVTGADESGGQIKLSFDIKAEELLFVF